MSKPRDPAKEQFCRQTLTAWQDRGLSVTSFCQQRQPQSSPSSAGASSSPGATSPPALPRLVAQWLKRQAAQRGPPGQQEAGQQAGSRPGQTSDV